MFLDFAGDRPLVAHNAPFDMSFLLAAAGRSGIPLKATSVDTVVLSRALYPELKKHKLDVICQAPESGGF